MNNYPGPILDIIWQRAAVISADNENKGFRKDTAGRWIKRQYFNQPQQEYGWVLSKQPESINELEEDSTIIPLHWQTSLEQNAQQKSELEKVNIELLSPQELTQSIYKPVNSKKYWQYANQISADNENKGFRTDYYGKWIQQDAFGDKNHEYGWTLAYLTPTHKKASIQPRIIPVHINTEEFRAHAAILAAKETDEEKIKYRRENVAFNIIIVFIECIMAIPKIIFSIFKG
ncbi:hypothetical protein M997_1309 [Proteus hauseri ATCC 700826]|uniref:Uncharacterized protein n=1 Tax=Proteus hauseri ATCC 700826 TaxID=1354271 RepID=A0AAJ3LU63_PROHU|nr:hypothetical protein [Proteus hauseri]OAT47816.1 hypothetical protein M997_1309 [Proteus hauseri ATCC 700826]